MIRDELIHCLLNTILQMHDVNFSIYDANINSIVMIHNQSKAFIEKTKFKQNSLEKFIILRESSIHLKEVYLMNNPSIGIYISITNSNISIIKSFFKEKNQPSTLIKSINSSVILKAVTLSFTKTYFYESYAQEALFAKISLQKNSTLKAEKVIF